MGSVYKQQLNDWKKSLDVKADLCYDIGGAQDPLKGMTNSWDVKDYKIIDLPIPHVLKQEADIKHDMNFVIDDYPEADLIFCLGVSDYIINPNIFMDNIYKLLKKGGMAWVEFPFVYSHHEPVWDEGCRYSEGCITRLAKQSNLIIKETIRKTAGNPHLVEFYRQDGHRMSRNYRYHNVTGFIVRFSK